MHHSIASTLLSGVYSICSPRQAAFRPAWSTLNHIHFISQSISNGFNKPKHVSRTILVTIDFSKAFESVWHPILFYKLILAGLSSYFAHWTPYFLSDRRTCVVYQNCKSCSSPLRCFARIRSWFCTFLSFYQWFSSVSAFFRQLLSLCWPFGSPSSQSLLL